MYDVQLAPLVSPNQVQRWRAEVERVVRAEIEREIRTDLSRATEPDLEQALRREITADLEQQLRRELEASIRQELRPRPKSAAQKIVGVWETVLSGSLAFMEFTENGSFRTWTDDRSNPTATGTYRVTGNRIVMQSPDGSESGQGIIEFPLDWKLVITRDSEAPAFLYRSR